MAIKFSVYYPKGEDTTFDHDYYRDKHVPLAVETWGVEKFEITGESATFPAGTTVWVWTRIKGGEGNIKHVWKKDGKDVWTATLNVGGKDWRTQSRRTIPKNSSSGVGPRNVTSKPSMSR